jgi:hypothetical protein
MIAIQRLQSIMWILVVAMGALTAYLVSLKVATERNAVRHVIDQIRWTRADIRYLEAEFGARASMRQLAAWNQNDLRLYVPGPGQYLPNERALANLDRMAPVEGGYAPPPVMTAMVTQAPASAPAPAAVAKVAAPAPEPASDFALIRTASAAEPRPVAVLLDASRAKSAAPARVAAVSMDRFIKPAGAPDAAARKAARLALLDARLLGASTPGLTAGEGKVR